MASSTSSQSDMAPAVYLTMAVRMSWMYALFMAVSGSLGYYQKGSLMSLYAGLISGFVALCAWGLMRASSGRYLKPGLIILSVLGGVLMVVFSRRILTTGEVMPGGFLFMNSGAMLLVAIQALKELKVAQEVVKSAATKTSKSVEKKKNN